MPLIIRNKKDSLLNRIALITGITGQDGSYLAEFLLEKGYTVHGMMRKSGSLINIRHIFTKATSTNNSLILHYGDMTDGERLKSLISFIKPTEIYNLAAQSHVKVSFDSPDYTEDVNAAGVSRILEAIICSGLVESVRFYQASSSELFGKAREVPQNELTPFNPTTPYGVCKERAFQTVVKYRATYGIFGSNGIMYNHESPRRGTDYVTRKITRAVAKIHLKLQEHVELGNLNSERDWGHAQEYVEAMYKILQQDEPDDFIIATGESHSIREFVELAFLCVGIKIGWEGAGVNELGKDVSTGTVRVKVNPQFYRPLEVELLVGDSKKAKEVLNWAPKSNFQSLVSEMIETDIKSLKLDLINNKY